MGVGRGCCFLLVSDWCELKTQIKTVVRRQAWPGAEELSSGPSWSIQQDLVNSKRGERGREVCGVGRVAMLKLKATILFKDAQISTTSQGNRC